MSSEDETSGTPGVAPAGGPEAGETGGGASSEAIAPDALVQDVGDAQVPWEALPEGEPAMALAYADQANLVTAPASTLTIREAGEAPFEPASEVPPSAVPRPTFVFLGVVSALTLAADIGSKAWAEVVLNRRGFEPIELIGKNLSVTLAYNKGGAWGMFQDAGEMVRKPFFICVSLAAIWFIVSLYARLHKSQKALTWGLPLVLGGALGNLSDRITRSQVIDFIDYQADWVMQLNAWIRSYYEGWTVTDHWPTFNVADIAICIGVGLMGVDMYTSRRRHKSDGVSVPPPPAPPTPREESTEVAQTTDPASVSV